MSKKFFYIVAFVLLSTICFVAYLILAMDKQDKITQNQQVKIQNELQTQPTIKLQPNNCPSDKEEVNIVLITDSRYTPPTGVSMYSAIKTKCPTTSYNFYIVAENITKQDEDSLYKLQSLAPDTVQVKIIPQQEPEIPFENMQRFLQYKVGMHKIYLPQILKEIDKVIYMDGDTLVLKDLRKLYDMDISDVYAAVAKDGIFYRFPKEMAEMGLDKRGYYFNSGVMLYNLKKQREDNIVEKLEEYIKTHEDFYGDQDVLNAVFGDKLKLMSYRYNCISTFFEEDDLNFLSQYFGEDLPQNTFNIYENATILHYAGDKPWQENYHPEYLKELWFRFYNEMLRI